MNTSLCTVRSLSAWWVGKSHANRSFDLIQQDVNAVSLVRPAGVTASLERACLVHYFIALHPLVMTLRIVMLVMYHRACG